MSKTVYALLLKMDYETIILKGVFYKLASAKAVGKANDDFDVVEIEEVVATENSVYAVLFEGNCYEIHSSCEAATKSMKTSMFSSHMTVLRVPIL